MKILIGPREHDKVSKDIETDPDTSESLKCLKSLSELL